MEKYRKEGYVMKGNKICLLTALIFTMSMLVACGDNSQNTAADHDEKGKTEIAKESITPETEENVIGQLTAIGQDSISVSVISEMNMTPPQSGSKPENTDGKTSEGFDGKAPEDFEGKMPEDFSGDLPEGATPPTEGQMPDINKDLELMPRASESKSYVVTDSTIYKKDDETITLSDLKIGDFVTMTVNGNEVESITVDTGFQK